MSSKNKVARHSLAQKGAKSPVEKDLFEVIGKDLHKNVLSFILCIGDHNYHYLGQEMLVKSCRTLPHVSNPWRVIVGDLMNAQMDTQEEKLIMTSRELAELKSRAAQLDLMKIGKNFIKDIKEIWDYSLTDEYDYGQFDGLHGGGPLELIVNHFGGGYNGFEKLVAMEYRKFLIVKCVETLVAKKAGKEEEGSKLIKTWNEKCVPSKLLDKFWHAHMLSPKKYAADCEVLIGETIDHDAGYVSENSLAGSDYASKKKLLFEFEAQFPRMDYFRGRLGNDGEGESDILFGSDFNIDRLAAIIWSDMNGDNDCG